MRKMEDTYKPKYAKWIYSTGGEKARSEMVKRNARCV